MRLLSGGIDIFYIDESHDNTHYVVTAVTVPFLRPSEDFEGKWDIVWEEYLDEAKLWRKWIKDHLHIPRSKELHGSKLLSGRGRYNRGKHSFTVEKAREAYERILERIDFLPNGSIFSVSIRRGRQMYGASKLEGAMHGLFQRMRRQSVARRVNAITFFDQGHPEYRKLYRRSQVFLPTGSQYGGWGGGGRAQNMPLSMFTKDGNDKTSKFCHFTQIADLVAYAAFLKIKGGARRLTEEQRNLNHHSLYDAIPLTILNTRVSVAAPRDAIVRL